MKTYGKLILMGEHSVVYGHKAIAIPFTEGVVDVRVEASPVFTLESSLYTGPLSEVGEELYGLRDLLEKLAEDLSLEPVRLVIKSSLPVSSGLGSSAATSTSIVKAIFAYKDRPLKQDQLFDYVQYSEGIIHGVSSGIDALITTTSNAYIFSKDGDKTLLDIAMDAYIVVGDSGEKSSTKKAVEKVKHQMEDLQGKKEIALLGQATNGFSQALKNRNLIEMAAQMNRAGDALNRLGLESKKLSEMRAHALDLGALASKLTGAGLGGCILALTDNMEVAKKIQKQWMIDGNQAWIMSLRGEKI